MKKNTPLVSIIMPVYNANNYVGKAISSILDQSYTHFELIIIDDGSSDGSGSICDDFSSKDSRVKVIHQTNHGLCNARNIGLETSGDYDYVLFSDHDDIYLDGSIEELVHTITETKADIVKGTYCGEIQKSDGTVRSYEAKMPSKIFSLSELINHYREFNYTIRAMWNGIYKAGIINDYNIRFDESLKAGAEDYRFNLEYLSHVKTVGLTSFPLYMHYARENQSASVGYNENRQKGIVVDYCMEANLLKKCDISVETYLRHQLWYYSMLIHEFSFTDTPLTRNEIFTKLNEFAENLIEFREVTPKEKISLFKTMPKTLLRWELMRSKHADILFRYDNFKHR